MTLPQMTFEEYKAEARKRYGDNAEDWKFRCPVCKHVASVKDYREANFEGGIAFACIGRATVAKRDEKMGGDGPCNYTGSGFLKLNPIDVILADGSRTTLMDFPDDPIVPDGESE